MKHMVKLIGLANRKLNDFEVLFLSYTFLPGKQWRRKQMRIITDKVFDRVGSQSGRAKLGFEDLYIAVLLVYK